MGELTFESIGFFFSCFFPKVKRSQREGLGVGADSKTAVNVTLFKPV